MSEAAAGRIVHYWPAMPGGLNRADHVIAHMDHAQPHAAIITFVHKNGTINVARFNHDGVSIPEAGIPLMQGDTELPTHGGWAVWPQDNWRPKPSAPAMTESAAGGKDDGGLADPNAKPDATT